MKRILSIFVTILFTATAFGQSSKVVTAYNSYTAYMQSKDKSEIQKAQENIDLAIAHEKTMAKTKTWLYRANIYAEMAKMEGSPELSDGALLVAYESYMKAKELDLKNRSKNDISNGLMFIGAPMFNMGHAMLKVENYEESHKYFTNAFKISEHLEANVEGSELDLNALWASGLSIDNAGNKEEAEKIYIRLIEEYDYDEPAVYQYLSRIYRDRGDDENANKVMGAALEKYPENIALIIEELNILIKQDKKEEAFAKMQKAIEIDPENKTLHFAMGSLYDQQGQPEDAVASYQKAIDIDAGYFDAYYNLGSVYYNQAADIIKEMNNLDFSEQAKYDELKGKSEKLFDQALPYFEKCREIKSDDTNTLIALKEIYARKNMFDKVSEIKALLGN